MTLHWHTNHIIHCDSYLQEVLVQKFSNKQYTVHGFKASD